MANSKWTSVDGIRQHTEEMRDETDQDTVH